MKCLGCGTECPDTAKFCHNCGKPFLANHATEKNTDDKIIDDTPITNEPAATINKDDVPASDDLFGNKSSKTLIIFAVIAVVVIGIVVFSTVIHSAESQTTTRVFITSQTTTETTTEETTTINYEKLEQEKQEFIDSCEEVSFKTLDRYSDDYDGKRVKVTGEVIQAIHSEYGVCQYRVNITKSDYGNYSDTIYVTYIFHEGETKIIEDDIITIYGIFSGPYTYESTIGSNVTVPKISARYITIDEMSE